MLRWIPGLLCAFSFAAPPAVDPAFTINLSHLNGAIVPDHQGNLVLTARSTDCSLPVVHPLSTCGWLWIGKLDPTGQNLLFATYFGDPKAQANVTSVHPDAQGNIVVVSYVSDSSLPAINAIQAQAKGSVDVHIFKLAGDGSHVIYATYLGGSGFDLPEAAATDAQGAAYILLQSDRSPDFPTTPQSLKSNALDNWVLAKLSPDGQALQYAAAFPKFGSFATRLEVDSAGSAWTVVENQIVQLAPDGSALQRRPLPPWAANQNPPVLPLAAGGYWLAGTEQNARPPIPYVRIENSQIPPLAQPLAAQHVSAFAVDPFEPWRIYAATDSGLFVSPDNGWSWYPTFFTAPCDFVAVDPFDQNTLYVTSLGGFYRSTDRAQTWLRTTSVSGSISADPHVQGLIYSAAARSEDGGTTWQPFVIPQPVNGPCGSGCLFTNATGAIADPSQPRRVYVFTQTRCLGFCFNIPGLLRSDDGGRSFAGVPLAASAPGGIAIDPSSRDLFVVSGGVLTAFRGSRLDQAEKLSTPEAQSVAVDPLTGAVYLSLTNCTVIQSSDGGRTWSLVTTVPAPAQVMTVSINGVLHLTQPSTITNTFAFHYDSDQIVSGGAFGGWSTTVFAAALGANGHLYLGGSTGGGLPVQNAWQSGFAGGTDGFLAEFDSAGALLNSTYLGGALAEQVYAIVPLDDGSVIVLGSSTSPEFLSRFPASVLGGGYYFILRFTPPAALLPRPSTAPFAAGRPPPPRSPAETARSLPRTSADR